MPIMNFENRKITDDRSAEEWLKQFVQLTKAIKELLEQPGPDPTANIEKIREYQQEIKQAQLAAVGGGMYEINQANYDAITKLKTSTRAQLNLNTFDHWSSELELLALAQQRALASFTKSDPKPEASLSAQPDKQATAAPISNAAVQPALTEVQKAPPVPPLPGADSARNHQLALDYLTRLAGAFNKVDDAAKFARFDVVFSKTMKAVEGFNASKKEELQPLIEQASAARERAEQRLKLGVIETVQPITVQPIKETPIATTTLSEKASATPNKEGPGSFHFYTKAEEILFKAHKLNDANQGAKKVNGLPMHENLEKIRDILPKITDPAHRGEMANKVEKLQKTVDKALITEAMRLIIETNKLAEVKGRPHTPQEVRKMSQNMDEVYVRLERVSDQEFKKAILSKYSQGMKETTGFGKEVHERVKEKYLAIAQNSGGGLKRSASEPVLSSSNGRGGGVILSPAAEGTRFNKPGSVTPTSTQKEEATAGYKPPTPTR